MNTPKLPPNFVVTAQYGDAQVGHVEENSDRNGWTFIAVPMFLGLNVNLIPNDHRAFVDTISHSFILRPAVPLVQMVWDVEDGTEPAARLEDLFK